MPLPKPPFKPLVDPKFFGPIVWPLGEMRTNEAFLDPPPPFKPSVDPKFFGPIMWPFGEMCTNEAFLDPMRPTDQEITNILEFITRIYIRVILCLTCDRHYRIMIVEQPPPSASSIKQPNKNAATICATYFCGLHNTVSRNTKKPEFDCNYARDSYDVRIGQRTSDIFWNALQLYAFECLPASPADIRDELRDEVKSTFVDAIPLLVPHVVFRSPSSSPSSSHFASSASCMNAYRLQMRRDPPDVQSRLHLRMWFVRTRARLADAFRCMRDVRSFTTFERDYDRNKNNIDVTSATTTIGTLSLFQSSSSFSYSSQSSSSSSPSQSSSFSSSSSSSSSLLVSTVSKKLPGIRSVLSSQLSELHLPHHHHQQQQTKENKIQEIEEEKEQTAVKADYDKSLKRNGTHKIRKKNRYKDVIIKNKSKKTHYGSDDDDTNHSDNDDNGKKRGNTIYYCTEENQDLALGCTPKNKSKVKKRQNKERKHKIKKSHTRLEAKKHRAYDSEGNDTTDDENNDTNAESDHRYSRYTRNSTHDNDVSKFSEIIHTWGFIFVSLLMFFIAVVHGKRESQKKI